MSMLDRSSIMDIKKKKNYQNTFKLEPDEKTPMNEAKQIINDVIRGDFIRSMQSSLHHVYKAHARAWTTKLQAKTRP